MASPQETVEQEVYRCYHCGLESECNLFKYFDNKKMDQPRYKCAHCQKLFTLGLHNRPQGKTYAKKRNEDPDELKNLSRQCRHCGVADNALFKYYNNNNHSQPRFKCLNCGKQFQMRLMGTGENRHLAHTSCARETRAPRGQKQSVPAPASYGFEDRSYQLSDGSLMQMQYDPLMPLEPSAMLLPETALGEDVQYSYVPNTELATEENYGDNFTSWPGNGDNAEPAPVSGDEDVEFVNFLEAELLEEEKIKAPNEDASCSTDNFTSWPGNGDNAEPALVSGDEDVEFVNFLEAELLGEEKIKAPNEDASCSAADVADAFPPTWSNEDAVSSTANVAYAWPPSDAEFVDYTDANVWDNEAQYAVMASDDNMAEMVSESASANIEAMYGTRELENLATFDSEPSWTWTRNDPSVDPSVDPYNEICTDDAAHWEPT